MQRYGSYLIPVVHTSYFICFILMVQNLYLKNNDNEKYYTRLMDLSYWHQCLLKYLFDYILPFIIHAIIYLRKLVDNVLSSRKTDLTTIVNYEALIFYLKANFHLNWIWFSCTLFHTHLLQRLCCLNQIFNLIPMFCILY